MKRTEINKILCGFMVGAVTAVSVVGLSMPSVAMAVSQNTVVCDDTTCWNVTVTVPDSICLYAGKKKALNVQLSNSNGIKKTFSSSDTSVATVSSSGKITGKKKGMATITTTISGEHVQKKLTFSTKITVKKPSIQIIASKKTVKVGKSIILKVKKQGTGKSVQWAVNKKSIASIGKTSGKLRGKKAGTVKVTATCGKLKKSITIKVK